MLRTLWFVRARHVLGLAAIAAIALVVGWLSPAGATEPAPTPPIGSATQEDDRVPIVPQAEEAELQFLLGVESFARKDYRSALEHLLMSNRLAPNKNVVYNIARCYEEIGQFEQAYQAYAGYVSREVGDDGRRRDAIDAMTGLQGRVALVTVETVPPGATVYIDRADLGVRGVTPVTLAVSPGDHTVIADLAGYRASQKPATASVGSRVQVQLGLDRILAQVRVSGTPEGATIRNLDGENPDPLPILGATLTLPLGKSTLEIAKDGYAPVQIVVEPKDGVLEKYAVTLQERMDENRILELFTKEAQSKSDTRIYGYIDSHFETKLTQYKEVDGDTGKLTNFTEPPDFDVANFHFMVQGTVVGRYRYFVNMAAPGSGSWEDEPVVLRNAWVEAPILRELLLVRFGKLYRRFGIYNEILDAVPTFIGIEPPELFDKDHLLLTRTTNFMLLGRADLGPATLEYSATTGTDERSGTAFPVGGDVRLTDLGPIMIGTSGYWSGGPAEPTQGVGDGSPRGGVINWMSEDEFVVYGGYFELLGNGPILQIEGWQADHDGTRDPDAVQILGDAPDALIGKQRQRFFDDDGNVIVHNKYSVRTAYVRGGYEVPVGRGNVTPYFQVDYYSNPEILFIKDYGGDDEAGLSDTGAFTKLTAGTVLRPVPPVALKIDGSVHIQPVNGETYMYPEIRVNLSYLWELNQ